MLLCDTGVVFAALDQRDRDHGRCAALLGSGDVVAVPGPVIAEVDWIGRARGAPGAFEQLLASIVDDSLLVVELDAEGYRRIHELMGAYADLPLDLVDAAVVATAERLEQDTIATLDHRHFSVVRPAHVDSFRLVP